MSLNVLIIDDHEVARLGLSSLLETNGHRVHGSTATGGDAIALLANGTTLDVVLLDVRMPGQDGMATIEAIREIQYDLPIVIFSAYDSPTYVARAVALGANEYVLKNGSSSSLNDAMMRAANGQEPPASSPLMKVRRVMQEEVDVGELPSSFPLTCREAQVLRHIALGLSNKEIARSLSISVETVKEHVQNTLRKIKARDRTDAAVRAIKGGLLEFAQCG